MISGRSKTGLIILLLLIAVYIINVYRNAWVCDDAYITIRCIDNFLHGHGLTFNIIERVQAFTHPLWVLLLLPAIAAAGHVYFAALLLSFCLSLETVLIFAFKFERALVLTALGLLAMALSDAFVDYSTSGLENPLTFFILIIFLYVFLGKKLNHRNFLILSLLSGLAILTRMDTILFYLPAIGYAFWKLRGRRAFLSLVAGLFPFILWEFFSLWYYGMLFPNTAYAKLNTGIDGLELAGRGLIYLYNSLRIDPLTIFIIAVGLIIPFLKNDRKGILIALGLFLGLIYVVRIGGCFMSGRHLAAPFLVALVLMLRNLKPVKWPVLSGLVGIILILGLLRPYSPAYTRAGEGYERAPAELGHHIIDERAWYQLSNGLINYNGKLDTWPDNTWADVGRRIRADSTIRNVGFLGVIGMVGYYGGPKLHIVDAFALADPLLARLPVIKELEFKVGHFRRHLPPGYYRSIEEGENLIEDEYLAPYYDKLMIMTRGDLFSAERLVEILRFNLGLYDHYRDRYLEPHLQKLSLASVSEPKKAGTLWWAATNIIMSQSGVEISLSENYHEANLEISTEGNDDMRFIFLNDGHKVGDLMFSRVRPEAGELEVFVTDIPTEAVEAGFDAIRILPLPGDGRYVIGHVRLLGN